MNASRLQHEAFALAFQAMGYVNIPDKCGLLFADCVPIPCVQYSRVRNAWPRMGWYGVSSENL